MEKYLPSGLKIIDTELRMESIKKMSARAEIMSWILTTVSFLTITGIIVFL